MNQGLSLVHNTTMRFKVKSTTYIQLSTHKWHPEITDRFTTNLQKAGHDETDVPL